MNKIKGGRRTALRIMCAACREPVRMLPPYRWVDANGPRPRWSHVDGEPLCTVVGPDDAVPARPRRAPVAPVRRFAHRTVAPSMSGRGWVFVVAGGDMVAVFDTRHAADIMATTMTGANLEPVTARLTTARWDVVRTRLRTHQPPITISDARAYRDSRT